MDKPTLRVDIEEIERLGKKDPLAALKLIEIIQEQLEEQS